ncbi:OspG family effector kinase [Burkholderia pyrrocinia]
MPINAFAALPVSSPVRSVDNTPPAGANAGQLDRQAGTATAVQGVSDTLGGQSLSGALNNTVVMARPQATQPLNFVVRSVRARRPVALTLNIPKTSEAGAVLGRGLCGEVREDLEHDGFVVKEFRADRSVANAECELFKKVYGEESAKVFEKDGQTYLRMLRVPGKPLNACDELPANSRELFLSMLADLGDLKIIHGDLHAGNIMYDAGSGKFWPIDMSNAYEAYYSTPSAREFMDRDNQQRFDQIIRSLPDPRWDGGSSRLDGAVQLAWSSEQAPSRPAARRPNGLLTSAMQRSRPLQLGNVAPLKETQQMRLGEPNELSRGLHDRDAIMRDTGVPTYVHPVRKQVHDALNSAEVKHVSVEQMGTADRLVQSASTFLQQHGGAGSSASGAEVSSANVLLAPQQ